MEDTAETPKITEALLKAAQEIGEYPTDVNGKEQKGTNILIYKILLFYNLLVQKISFTVSNIAACLRPVLSWAEP